MTQNSTSTFPSQPRLQAARHQWELGDEFLVAVIHPRLTPEIQKRVDAGEVFRVTKLESWHLWSDDLRFHKLFVLPAALGDNHQLKLTHWVERYWVKRSGQKRYYERYCWMEGRRIRRCHVRGSGRLSRRAEIEEAVALGKSPAEIVAMLRII